MSVAQKVTPQVGPHHPQQPESARCADMYASSALAKALLAQNVANHAIRSLIAFCVPA